MERLTGTGAFELMEAYNSVYAPQELTEEQVWEEVETWVNGLVEEGYDLSGYTWEDMYEAYITEIAVNFGGQAAVDRARAQFRQQQQARSARPNPADPYGVTPRRPAPAQPDKATDKALAPDVAAMKRQIAITPPGRDPEFYRPPAPSRPASRPAPSSSAPRAGATAPAPSRPASKPTTAPVGKPPQTTTPTPAPQQLRYNPLMQRTFGYQSGFAPSQVSSRVATAFAPSTGSLASTPSTTSIAFAPGTGNLAARTAQQSQTSAKKSIAPTRAPILQQSFDPFDVVMDHLIDEGYAENEEAATVIMANMSEEWRQSIIEGVVDTKTMTADARRRKRNDEYRSENPTLPSGNPMGPNAQLMRQMAHAEKRGVKTKGR